MAFIRKIEDFKCENCSFFVIGDGYTNHCPECLWSKHVDINPGDRLGSCCGLMAPIGFEKDARGENIVHSCIKCEQVKKNRLSKADNYDKVILLSSRG